MTTEWQSQGLIQFSVTPKPAVALPPFLGGPVLLSIQCVSGSGDSPSSLLLWVPVSHCWGEEGISWAAPVNICQNILFSQTIPPVAVSWTRSFWSSHLGGAALASNLLEWISFFPPPDTCPQLGNNNNNNLLLVRRSVPFPKLSLD